MLHAIECGEAVFQRYHDTVFERFWRRDLDIENINVIAEVLAMAGGDAAAFKSCHVELRARVEAISRDAEEAGVFGVPSFIVNGELFWGREHLADIETMLQPR